MVVYRFASGGDGEVDVAILRGLGDGTFTELEEDAVEFVHNNGACGSSPSNIALLADFDNDAIGDVLLGLDDDGDAGSAWFYPGRIEEGGFIFDWEGCVEAFDLHPEYESGGESPGHAPNSYNFDLDFDGNEDVLIGYRHVAPWVSPSRIVWLRGLGDGTFEPPSVIRDFPGGDNGLRLAVPRRTCARYPGL
jgi:hypothetical protein